MGSNLQFQAEEHGQEDEAEAKEADGQTDQPSEQSPLPGWVVELLTAGDGTATFHPLQRHYSLLFINYICFFFGEMFKMNE